MPGPDTVLSVVWYKIRPSDFGGQKGIAIFSEYLGQQLSLRLLCAQSNSFEGTESYSPAATLPVSKTQFTDPRAWWQLRRELQSTGAGVLLLEHCYYGLAGLWLQRSKGVKLVVHSHNIEYERFRQLGRWWWPLLYWIERITHKRADLNLFKTEEDMALALRKFGLDTNKCMVVPYGIEKETLPDRDAREKARAMIMARHGIGSNKTILLFNGTLDYLPNAIAMETIIKEIIPRLGNHYHVIICGRIIDPKFEYLRELSAPDYTYAGYVDNIETYFLGADAFINPVHLGGGVKTKVVEALSYGLPVVSYRSGATGIDLSVTAQQLKAVADQDVNAFVKAILDINYGSTPEPAFFRRYHWRNITASVAERIRQLVRE